MPVYPGLDADTIALFRLDETTRGDYTLNDTGPNARHMTTESTALSAIVPGPRSFQGRLADRTQGCLARRLQLVTANMQNGNAGGDALALQGNWTYELWLYLDVLHAAGDVVMQYTSSGGLQANNAQFSFSVLSTGRLRCFWEHGVRVGVTTDTSSGALFTAAGWRHVAIRKETNGANKQLTFFLDGVKLQTITGLANCDGGSTSGWSLGHKFLTASMIGNVRSIYMTSTIVSDAQIAVDAANTTGSTAYTHTADANTIVCWQCDERPDRWDDAGNFHLRMVAVSDPPGTAGGTFTASPPLIADGGQGAYFNGGAVLGNGTEYQASRYLNSIITAAIAAGCAVECWFRMDDTAKPTINRPLVCFGDPGPEDQPNNYLCIAIDQSASNGSLQVDWEHGAGVNSIATSTNPMLDSTTVLESHYMRVDLCPESGQTRVYMTLDDTLFYTSGLLTNFDGGTSSVLRIGAGAAGAGGGSTDAGFKGIIDHVRISNACHNGATTYADSISTANIVLAVEQNVIKANDTRRITAEVGSFTSAGTFTANAADSGSVLYFLFRQDAAGSGLTLLNPGGTAMTDISSGAGTDWEATLTFPTGDAHVVVVIGTVNGVAVIPGMAFFVPPKFYFDPTGLFS